MFAINQDSVSAFDEIERRARLAEHPIDFIAARNKMIQDRTTAILYQLNEEVSKGPFAGHLTFTRYDYNTYQTFCGEEPRTQPPFHALRYRRFSLYRLGADYVFHFTPAKTSSFTIYNLVKSYRTYIEQLIEKYAKEMEKLTEELYQIS